MRYVWDLYDEYCRRVGVLRRMALKATAGRLRKWDRDAAQSVAAFVANSNHVADRIARHYGRRSVTVYPPVEQFGLSRNAPEDFYLVVGEHVEYKRPDLAVDACRRLGRKLVVIGDGPLLAALKKHADRNIRILGWQDDEVVRDYLSRCRAVLFCGQEDFGMVPVEAQSMGRPVIAYNAGGATETVVHHRTGILFDAQTPDAVADAILELEEAGDLLSPAAIADHAARFSVDVFKRDFGDFVTWCVDRWTLGGPDAVRKYLETEIDLPVTWTQCRQRGWETHGHERGCR